MFAINLCFFGVFLLGIMYTSDSLHVEPDEAVYANLEQEDPISASIAGIVSAASAAVSAGTSVAGTTMSALMGNGYSVSCGIEIENWTKYALTLPIAHVKGGVLSVPPIAILPGKREVMVSHKSSGSATGTYGSVSWLIESSDLHHQRRLVLMWSAPYDFNLYSNTLAVGLTNPSVTTHTPGSVFYDKMYYDEPISALKYTKKEFVRDFSPIIFEDADYQIVATMGSSHKAQVKIHIRPKKTEDLAAVILAQLQKKK